MSDSNGWNKTIICRIISNHERVKGKECIFFKVSRVENIFGVWKLTEIYFLTIIKIEKCTAIIDKEYGS